jgi:hypothetical protein
VKRRSLFERFISLLNPCVHQWRVIETLKDDLEHPSSVTIIRECDVCGDLDTEVIQGPTHRITCPPHKWRTLKRIQVWTSDSTKYPTAFDYEQECMGCGDLRVVRLGEPEQPSAKPRAA